MLAETTIRTSTDVYFRERTPWRIGTVVLDCGPSFVAHLHGDVREGDRVRMTLRLDKSGNAVALAMPDRPTPYQEDDVQLRELTCDPKFRRVLITDGRNATGQAMARAMAGAGAVDRFRWHRRSVEALSRLRRHCVICPASRSLH